MCDHNLKDFFSIFKCVFFCFFPGPKKYVYETRQLFGAQSPDLEVFSRSVAELFATDPVSRPVLVSLGLDKAVDPATWKSQVVPFIKAQIQV